MKELKEYLTSGNIGGTKIVYPIFMFLQVAVNPPGRSLETKAK